MGFSYYSVMNLRKEGPMNLSEEDMEKDFWFGSKRKRISDGNGNHYSRPDLEFQLRMEEKTIPYGIWLK